jgi:ATP adenylyltransferase
MEIVAPGVVEATIRTEVDCAFCADLRASHPPLAATPVAETSGFVAWASLGALAEGHVLVLPRHHVINMSALPNPAQHDLLDFVGALRQRLRERYGAVSMFEHGPIEPCSPVGCSIDHAHLHLVPCSSSLVRMSAETYPDLPWALSRGLREALAVPKPAPYLIVADDDDTTALAIDLGIGSQAIRKVLAQQGGNADKWNWAEHPNHETLARTLRALR